MFFQAPTQKQSVKDTFKIRRHIQSEFRINQVLKYNNDEVIIVGFHKMIDDPIILEYIPGIHIKHVKTEKLEFIPYESTAFQKLK